MGEIDSRYMNILRNTRCLDCTTNEDAIDSVETPLTLETRRYIQKMLREGKTDKQIFHNLTTLYGPHMLINTIGQDGSTPRYPRKMILPFIYAGVFAPLVICAYIFFKKPTRIKL